MRRVRRMKRYKRRGKGFGDFLGKLGGLASNGLNWALAHPELIQAGVNMARGKGKRKRMKRRF